MNNGYNQFFKKAQSIRQQAIEGKTVAEMQSLSDEEIETMLRKKMKPNISRKAKQMEKKRKQPIGLIFVSLMGAVACGLGIVYYDKVEKYVQKIEISLIGSASAEETKADAAKSETKATGETAKNSSGESAGVANGKEPGKVAGAESEAKSEIEIDHLTKLVDRKKELDAKEEELTRMEAEIQAQREALEVRMKELDETRRKIASVLDDRVKVDDQKVESLVQVYTNMRPPQAAKIFETLDEELAVEVLGRMKKKNAAEIMNLLKADKAQVISERLAGFKRK